MLNKFVKQLQILKELVTSEEPLKKRIRAASGHFATIAEGFVLESDFDEWLEGLSDKEAERCLADMLERFVDTIEAVLQPATLGEAGLHRAQKDHALVEDRDD